jgi:hypothetical protein
MAQSFEVELSMPETPEEAQARAAIDLTDAARAVGLRLTRRGPRQLHYRPRVQFPFLLMLMHTLNGERMTVEFSDREAGGSRVSIRGAVAGAKRGLAADPDHWSEALGAGASRE